MEKSTNNVLTIELWAIMNHYKVTLDSLTRVSCEINPSSIYVKGMVKWVVALLQQCSHILLTSEELLKLRERNKDEL